MTVRAIALMGNPVLLKRAAAVEDPADPALAELIQDMLDSMYAADGLGIAAPQIGISKRVVLFHAPDEDAAIADRAALEGSKATDLPLTILINPEVEILNPDQEEDWEGCLSVPGLRGLVPRSMKIRYQGLTPDGERVDRIVSGFHARVIQHECDHLDGVLYPMRMTDMRQLVYVSEIENMSAPAPASTVTAGPGSDPVSDSGECGA